MKDTDTRFHEEWLGLAQPIEGLVFSLAALSDAQIAPKVTAELSARFADHLEETAQGVALRDVRAFFERFLGYETPGMLVARDALPDALSFYAQEGRQQIRPSFAIARGPFAATTDPFGEIDARPVGAPTGEEATASADATAPASILAVGWDLSDDATALVAPSIDLDAPEAITGPWSYPPTAKFERFLRHVGVPIGFITNRRELRLVYAPPGESSGHLTFRARDLREAAGRPILAALELIFDARRTYGAAEAYTFEGLLRESRLRQANVTDALARQVFEAVEILLEGFEQAASRDATGGRLDWLRAALEAPNDHFEQGLLSVVLRLVFLLYSEDQGLLPVENSTYAEHLSVFGLYERLAEDAGSFPESMHHRFGAYGRLVALFRAVFLGVKHGDLVLPPRRGRLFDPSEYPFLEGGLPGWTAAITQPDARAEVRLPSVDDGTLYKVLRRLVIFQGQRLSYRALDVEQIGSIYESLMGYHVLRVSSPAVRLGKYGTWVEVARVRAMSAVDRKRFWKESCGLNPGPAATLDEAVASSTSDEALVDALLAQAPGRKDDRAQHRAEAGRLVLQPGDERRRTGSHYTPRSLSQKVVRRTLEPILACLGENRTAKQILELRICDPAMGSGAFLVETCRHLAEEIVAAWTRSGELAALVEAHGDALLHARRLVAQRCLYGVDKNAAAVELAKLSLWLVTLSKQLPFTFVDHALRHGDSLVGLDLDQVRAFHWKPSAQLPTCRSALDDALEQALEHRARILALADHEDSASQREKSRLLDYAELATERVRLIADVCVGAFFAETKDKDRERERDRRLAMVLRYLDGDEDAKAELETLAARIRAQHAPFHWMIEFPEVFYHERPDPLQGGLMNGAAFMEAFVGNPPFMGVAFITERLGDGYVSWLQNLHEGTTGKFDLSAHFFRRAASLLGAHGALGLIATNTIAQGDTRTTGLGYLVDRGWTIYDATISMPWPGAAAVTVSIVHAARGNVTRGLEVRLDGRPVNALNSRLRSGAERGDAEVLAENARCAFQGCIVLGMGFTLMSEERDALVAKDLRNAERIFPYLGGQEVNTSPIQTFDRYVINFGQMSLEEAERWPDLINILRVRVKPERAKSNRAAYRDRWWRFAEAQHALGAATAILERCIVCAITTKHLVFSFQPTRQIFANSLEVFALDAWTAFAVIQSRIHEPWARQLSSSMKTDLRYAASDCFETFPFPSPDPRTVLPAVEAAGEALYTARAKFMVDTDQGLTKTYNALKDPDVDDPRILELRHLHEAMDRAVLDAYGWTDLDVPRYCPRNDEERAAVRAFEEEIVDRLYALNEVRAREEQLAGLGGGAKGAKKKAGAGGVVKKKADRKGTPSPPQAGLFGDDETS